MALRVEVRFKNAALYNIIEEKYLSKSKEQSKYPGRPPLIKTAANDIGISYHYLLGLLNLRINAYKKELDPTRKAVQVAEHLGRSVVEIFPPSLYEGRFPSLMTRDIPLERLEELKNSRELLQEFNDPYVEQTTNRLSLEVVTRNALTSREHQVISMLYGLDGHGERTLKEIADHYGVVPERVRQISERALRKLRHPKYSKALGADFSHKHACMKCKSVISTMYSYEKCEHQWDVEWIGLCDTCKPKHYHIHKCRICTGFVESVGADKCDRYFAHSIDALCRKCTSKLKNHKSYCMACSENMGKCERTSSCNGLQRKRSGELFDHYSVEPCGRCGYVAISFVAEHRHLRPWFVMRHTGRPGCYHWELCPACGAATNKHDNNECEWHTDHYRAGGGYHWQRCEHQKNSNHMIICCKCYVRIRPCRCHNRDRHRDAVCSLCNNWDDI